MNRRKWMLAIAATSLTLALARESQAERLIVLPRPGQVGVGVQAQYGTLFDSGEVGTQFGSGPGYTVRVRYRMRYERAIGLSFENQTFDARSTARFQDFFGVPIPADSSVAPAKLSLFTAGFEVYQMFGTRTRTTRMLSAGVGLAQFRETLRDGETQVPQGGDGAFASVGAGVERFFYRSIAFDLSMRYMAVFQNSHTNQDLQASAGFIFYASY